MSDHEERRLLFQVIRSFEKSRVKMPGCTEWREMTFVSSCQEFWEIEGKNAVLFWVKGDDFCFKLSGSSEIRIQLFYTKGDDFEIENSPKSQCSISAKLYHNNHIWP